jgi:hypothetical protein
MLAATMTAVRTFLMESPERDRSVIQFALINWSNCGYHLFLLSRPAVSSDEMLMMTLSPPDRDRLTTRSDRSLGTMYWDYRNLATARQMG